MLVRAQWGRGRSIIASGTQRRAYKDAQCKMCPRFCFVSSWVTSCTETFWLPGGSNNRDGWISTRESGLGDAYSQVGVTHIMSGLHGGCFCSNKQWLPLQHIITLLRAPPVMKCVSSWTGSSQRKGVTGLSWHKHKKWDMTPCCTAPLNPYAFCHITNVNFCGKFLEKADTKQRIIVK